jgi:hypothetical protein
MKRGNWILQLEFATKQTNRIELVISMETN